MISGLRLFFSALFSVLIAAVAVAGVAVPAHADATNKRGGVETHKVDDNAASVSNTVSSSTADTGKVATPTSTGSTSSDTGDSGTSTFPGLS